MMSIVYVNMYIPECRSDVKGSRGVEGKNSGPSNIKPPPPAGTDFIIF